MTSPPLSHVLREALEVRRETLGNRHRHTLIAISNLDRLLLKKSKLRLAEKCYGAPKRFVRSTKSLGRSVGRLFVKAEASLTAAG